MYRLARAGRHPAEDTFEGYWRYQIDCGGDLCSYAAQLLRWQAAFGKSRVLVRFYEDLIRIRRGNWTNLRFYRSALHRVIAGIAARAGSAKVYSAPDRRALQRRYGWRSRRPSMGFPSRRAAR